MVACASCHRHSNLIKNVYPASPGEEGPRSAALSLLVFYASSKPQKLPKIGVFLEEKVEKDIGNTRFSHVGVTLAIITAILKDCKPNVSLFSKSVLRIILHVLNCPDLTLLKLAIETFILFTKIRNPEDAIDTEFSITHNGVVMKLCQEAVKVHSSGIDDQIKWRYHALNALEALCEFNYFVDGSKIDSTISTVLEAILKNIIYVESPRPGGRSPDTSTSVPSMIPTQITPNGVVSSTESPKLTEVDLSKLAVKCLKGIVRNCNALTFRSLQISIMKILDSANQLEDAAASLFLFPLLISSSETQYHFVVITYVLDRLASETRVPVKTTLIKIISYLILAEKLAGLTIPELLDIFVSHLNESSKLVMPLGSKQSDELVAMQVSLTKAIGCLAAHLAYPNQINEIIGFLVNRIQFDRQVLKLTTVQENYLVYVLMGLGEVMKLKDSKSRTSSRARQSFVPATVGYNLLIPLLVYFESSSLDVRVELCKVCNAVVNAGRVAGRQEAFQEFINALLSAICVYGSNQHCKPVDFVLLGMMMCNILSVNSPVALGSLIPVIFFLQKLSSKFQESHQRALATISVEFLLWAANLLSSAEFGAFMDQIKKNRILLNEWCPRLDFTEEAVDILRPLSFNDIEANSSSKPVTVFLDEVAVKKSLLNSLVEINEENAGLLKEEWNKEFTNENIRSLLPSSLSNLVPGSAGSKSNIKLSTERKISMRKVVAVKIELPEDTKQYPTPNAGNGGMDTNLVLAEMPQPSEIDESEAAKRESVPGVMEILRNITDTYGSPPTDRKSVVSREYSADVADRDLDFLRTRTKSNKEFSASSSPENTSPARLLATSNSNRINKPREPAIFDVQ